MTKEKKVKFHKKVVKSDAQKKSIEKNKKIIKKTKPKKSINEKLKKIANDKQKSGRPSILTKELIDRITKLIQHGSYIETACASVGIVKDLYYTWLKLGENHRQLLKNQETETDIEILQDIEDKIELINPLYIVFSDSINKAVVESELRDILRIDKAANKSWQAAAWKLERKHPQRWSRYNKMELSGKVETTPTIVDNSKNMLLNVMNDPEALDIAEMLVEKMTQIEKEKEKGEKK